MLQNRLVLSIGVRLKEFLTENGPADYALCVGGKVLGVVEGKKLSVGPQVEEKVTSPDPIGKSWKS